VDISEKEKRLSKGVTQNRDFGETRFCRVSTFLSRRCIIIGKLYVVSV